MLIALRIPFSPAYASLMRTSTKPFASYCQKQKILIVNSVEFGAPPRVEQVRIAAINAIETNTPMSCDLKTITDVEDADSLVGQCDETNGESVNASGTAKLCFIRSTSSTGGLPNNRLNSRLNCEALS